MTMADVFTAEKRSEVMSKIRSTDTKPELTVRKFLHSQGFRFRTYQKNLPGKPDVVLRKHNAVVFVNGCFWHGHKPCKIFRMPRTHNRYWNLKIEHNLQRDRRNKRELKTLGWRVFVVWECQLKISKAATTLRKLAIGIKAK